MFIFREALKNALKTFIFILSFIDIGTFANNFNALKIKLTMLFTCTVIHFKHINFFQKGYVKKYLLRTYSR
jgi:hypothetical protein